MQANISRRQHGFTLIELMVAVVIIGILMAVALPSYKQYVTRAKRTAAQTAMLDIANREEQYMLANRGYASLSALGYQLPADVALNYTPTITLPVSGPPGYTITLAVRSTGSQVGDSDLTLTNTGVKSPAGKW